MVPYMACVSGWLLRAGCHWVWYGFATFDPTMHEARCEGVQEDCGGLCYWLLHYGFLGCRFRACHDSMMRSDLEFQVFFYMDPKNGSKTTFRLRIYFINWRKKHVQQIMMSLVRFWLTKDVAHSSGVEMKGVKESPHNVSPLLTNPLLVEGGATQVMPIALTMMFSFPFKQIGILTLIFRSLPLKAKRSDWWLGEWTGAHSVLLYHDFIWDAAMLLLVATFFLHSVLFRISLFERVERFNVAATCRIDGGGLPHFHWVGGVGWGC